MFDMPSNSSNMSSDEELKSKKNKKHPLISLYKNYGKIKVK